MSMLLDTDINVQMTKGTGLSTSSLTKSMWFDLTLQLPQLFSQSMKKVIKMSSNEWILS